MRIKPFKIIGYFCFACLFILSYKIYFRYKPIPNWNPKHFMSVEGHISPSLFPNKTITWVAEYSSQNPRCMYDPTLIEGVKTNITTQRTITTQIDKKGNFYGKIALDYYLPGYCQWNIISIGYVYPSETPLTLKSHLLHNNDANKIITIANFDNDSSQNNKEKNVQHATRELLCTQPRDCTKIKDTFFSESMKPSHSYRYTLNIGNAEKHHG